VTRFAVEFEWQVAGRVSLDANSYLVFPVLPNMPGLYRLWIEGADERPGVYIGEASNLRRRMQSYRTPGVSQTTNIRLNELLKTAVAGGSAATVSIITKVIVSLDASEPRDLPLDRRNARLIAEQAAIAAAAVENLADHDAAHVFPRLLDRPGVGESEYE
jgi:hypothetical protein